MNELLANVKSEKSSNIPPVVR